MSAELNSPIWCAVCDVSSEGGTYLAFIHEHADCSSVERVHDVGGRVHNHPPYRPVCNERDVDGQLRGACLNDDGSGRSESERLREGLARWGTES